MSVAVSAVAERGAPAPADTAVLGTAVLGTALAALRQPVAVFDAGIGSYAIVQRLQQRFPWLDLIYFADRASFPYGGKPRALLAPLVRATVERLAAWGARAVVLASNAPSVMVLGELQGRLPVPVRGVFPPVREALAASRSGVVVVLGVASLAASPEIRAYMQREAAGRTVAVDNASAMVDLVENGAFLSDPEGTQRAVDGFMAEVLRRHPGVDVCTLSSTHLPWLQPFFERAAPGVRFLDPADAVVAALDGFVAPAHEGASGRHGQVLCVATESPAQPLSGLSAMLGRLGVSLTPVLVAPTSVGLPQGDNS